MKNTKDIASDKPKGDDGNCVRITRTEKIWIHSNIDHPENG